MPGRRAPPGVGRVAPGRERREVRSAQEPRSSASTTARSIAFSSSRTLPGQRMARGAAPAPRRRGPGSSLPFAVGVLAQEVLGEQRDVRRRARAAAAAGSRSRSAGSRGPRGSCPPRPSSCRSRLVAATMRTSTLRVSLPPTRSNSRSCRTRSSFTCTVGEMSPISSRKSVPPSAVSKRPARVSSAPVNEPFSWPKSSLSSSVSGRAAQVTLTKGLLAPRAVLVERLGDQLLARAALAQQQHRGSCEAATCRIVLKTASISGLSPTRLSKLYLCSSRSRRPRVSLEQALLLERLLQHDLAAPRRRSASSGSPRRPASSP